MKGQISFVEYLASLTLFITAVVFISLQLVSFVPQYLTEVHNQRVRIDTYQISELLVNDPGNPLNWNDFINLNIGQLAYWKFDEGSGTTASDSSGNGNTLSFQPNTAMVFDATYGSGPWGTSPAFPDPSANWIWRTSGAASSAPVEQFWVTRYFTLSSSGTTNFYFAIDNYGSVYVDNTFLGNVGGWSPTTSFSTSLSAGQHQLKILVGNAGTSPNPAGLLVSVKNSAGTILFDSQADGIWFVDPVWLTGEFGNSINLDLANFGTLPDSVAYARNSDSSKLPLGSSPRTIVAWINPTNFPDQTYNGIVSYGTVGVCLQGMVFSIKNDGRLSMAFWCNDAYQTIGPTVPFNQWTQVAMTYDGTTKINFYINGQFVQQTTTNAPGNTGNGPIRIGCTDDPGRCFDGSIDEVSIYNRTLSASEIQGLYNTPSGIASLRIGLSNQSSNVTNFVSLQKINALNDNCNQPGGYSSIKALISPVDNFAIFLFNRTAGAGNVLISCQPTISFSSPFNNTIRRIVAIDSGDIGELIVQTG